MLTTPPQHNSTSWARSSLSLKESPARVPDPEHLKAVWSQTSNKAGLHAVNSLEGIADDLTALPFTLQDVKSEDGETPPPSVPSAPSRMSLHDVTRAFQQVPSSSSTAPHRTPISPPLTNAPVARPTGYSYTPLPQGNMRPTYAYSSPMMSHSPTPTAMYPHPMASSPVPNRMQNGHTPLYSQPMWMTMAGPPQNPNMRPMGSPYPTQIMSYASPGTPNMYQHPLPNMPPNPLQQNPQNSRGRGMPVMSPVMSHATASMYASSPVLMHTPPIMQVTQNHGYMPLGRGQPRADSGQHQHQHPPPFNPVTSSTFARQTW